MITFGPVLSPQGGLGVRARWITDAVAQLGLRTSVISHHEARTDPAPSSVDALHVLQRPLRLGWSLELARTVRRLAPEVDALIVESALLLPAVRLARPRVPVIWDTNECETLHYLRLERTLENRLRLFVWRHIERWAVGWTDLIIAISDTEAGWWVRLFPRSRSKLVVVKHRVPVRSVDASAGRRTLERLSGRKLGGVVLLFVGTLSAKHNAAAAEWLLNELAPRLPANCCLVLVGPGTDHLGREASAKARIIYLGSVPEIDPIIAGADACLAPLKAGAGVKTKVIHYLAHGKPVLATPVALEGLERAPGVQVAELRDFPALVCDFLKRSENREEARERARAQRSWVQEEFGSDLVFEQLRAVLRRVGVAT